MFSSNSSILTRLHGYQRLSHVIRNIKDVATGKLKFDVLSKVMKGILVIYHSSAYCECLFNLINKNNWFPLPGQLTYKHFWQLTDMENSPVHVCLFTSVLSVLHHYNAQTKCWNEPNLLFMHIILEMTTLNCSVVLRDVFVVLKSYCKSSYVHCIQTVALVLFQYSSWHVAGIQFNVSISKNTSGSGLHRWLLPSFLSVGLYANGILNCFYCP